MAGRKADASARACPLQTYLSYVGKKAHFVKRGKTEGYVVRRFFCVRQEGRGSSCGKMRGRSGGNEPEGEAGAEGDGAGRWRIMPGKAVAERRGVFAGSRNGGRARNEGKKRLAAFVYSYRTLDGCVPGRGVKFADPDAACGSFLERGGQWEGTGRRKERAGRDRSGGLSGGGPPFRQKKAFQAKKPARRHARRT